MDISTLAFTGTFDYTVVNPMTGKATDIVFTLLGSDSKEYRKAKTKALRENVITAKAADDIDTDTINADIYAMCVVSWSNVMADGKELEFSYENAKELFMREGMGWLVDQISTQVERRSNFMKRPAKS